MDADGIIALCSVLIAFSALVIAAYSSYETRKYNRISMTPVLDDELVFNTASERIGLFVENKGVGPAVIDKWELLVDGEHYRKHGIERFEKLTEFLNLEENVNWGYFKPGSLLLQGQCCELFAVDSAPYSIRRNDDLRSALERITITITYTSLYKEKDAETYQFVGCRRFKKNFGNA